MKTIHKNVVPVGGLKDFEIPTGARVVHVDRDTHGGHDVVAFWVEVPLNAGMETERRTFAVVGTGMVVVGEAEYVGTAIDLEIGGAWHLYEVFRGVAE